MNTFTGTTNIFLTILLSVMGFGEKMELPVRSTDAFNNVSKSTEMVESMPINSGSDIIGYYTDLFGGSPLAINTVCFPKSLGPLTTLPVPPINLNTQSVILPTNTSSYNFNTGELVCLISREEVLLESDCINNTSSTINLAPLSPTAPQFFNNSLYGIAIENNGYAQGTLAEFEIVTDIQSGFVNGVTPGSFSPPTGYLFNHEQISSATNGTDELYFVSGTSLIVYNSNNPYPNYIPLPPSVSFAYYGLEYKSPGVLWALRLNNAVQSLELVEIQINSTSLIGVTTLYDLQLNVALAPPGWILNNEFYSTTLDTCKMKYYISTLYDIDGSSRLILIDVPGNNHIQQINAQYLFGIEMKDLTCENCTAEFNYTSIDSCGKVQFTSNTGGPGTFTYNWNFGDPSSGANNTSSLENPTHDYSACGMYTVILTVECPDGTILSMTQIVTIADNIPPTIMCPPNLNLKCDDDLSPASTGFATATDNCMIISPLTYTDDTLFMIPCDGLVERTWTATDWCGNTSSCIQNIVVRDNVPPILLNCPPSMTIYGTLDSLGACTANAVIISPTGTDNCSTGVNVTNNINGSGNVSGPFPIGSTTITWTATDSCMNTAICSTIITVSCDTCSCVGFDSLQFYMPSGTNVPGFNLAVSCGNMPAVTLPCIGSDALYQFSGDFQCSDSCAAQVNYEIVSLDDGSITTGYVTTYSTGGNYYHFDITSGIHPPPGNYQLVLTGSCNADTCLCIINFIVPPCIDCECGSYTDINYRPTQGAPNQNAVCGDTLLAQCNGNIPWTLNGNFLCAGTDCPDSTQMSWILTHPDGTVIGDSIVASPGFNILIQGTSFDTSGLYQLSIQAICGLDTCMCNFVIEVECDDCCDDMDEFCSIFENEVNLILDDPFCKATLDIGDLGPCDNFVEYIEWGDTHVDTGPFGSNSMIMHTYPGSGTYFIKWLAYGLDNSGNYCIEKEFLDTIYINCPAIICCDEEEEFLQAIENNIDIIVNSDLKQVEIVIGDILECDSISIKVWGDPHIPESRKYGRQESIIHDYSDCGTYEIQYLAEEFQDDTTTCFENIFIETVNLECTDCPCTLTDIQALSDAVDKGFATISTSIDCNICLAPLALSDCEIVEWFEGNLNTTAIGTTNGNQTFCYDFINSGTYTIIMLVKRYQDDGSVCEVFTKEQVVNVSCSIVPACGISVFLNSGFDEGSVAGSLGINGMGSTAGWKAAAGDPQVIDGESGSLNGWSIGLNDELDNIDVLTNIEPVCLDKNKGILKIRYGIKEKGIKSSLTIELYTGDDFEVSDSNNVWNPIRCLRLATIDLTPLETEEWYNMEIPYDLSTWMVEDSCGGISARIAVYARAENPIPLKTSVLIDEICVEESSSLQYITEYLRFIRHCTAVPTPEGEDPHWVVQFICLPDQLRMEDNPKLYHLQTAVMKPIVFPDPVITISDSLNNPVIDPFGTEVFLMPNTQVSSKVESIYQPPAGYEWYGLQSNALVSPESQDADSVSIKIGFYWEDLPEGSRDSTGAFWVSDDKDDLYSELVIDGYTLFDSSVLVSTLNLEQNTVFNIFPNPGKDKLTISYDGISGTADQIVVYDIFGREYIKEYITFNKYGSPYIQINNLPDGIYFIRIARKGHPIYVEKFVKQ